MLIGEMETLPQDGEAHKQQQKGEKKKNNVIAYRFRGAVQVPISFLSSRQ